MKMDTAREIRLIEVVDDAMAEIYRSKTPAERLAMIFAGNRTMRLRLQGHLRTYHSDWSDVEIKREVARRMLGGTT